MENSTSESGIFNSSLMQKINRKCNKCVFNEKLNRNLTKYIFDFFYYRELYQICSANLFLYQCFTEYQLMTWTLEMNNIIDIFHLDIKNYEEEIDDTLTLCIKNKRTYYMKDHPGCFIRINKEGINIFSIAYYDPKLQKEFFHNKTNNSSPIKKNNNYNNINIENASPLKEENSTSKNNDSESPLVSENNIISIKKINTIESNSEITSNFGSMGSINYNKNNDINPWETKFLHDSYNNNKCIFLNKTTPINFGFSFYHVIKGDYQLYLHHSLINMKNARLILQVTINGKNVYTVEDFPSNNVFEQDNREQTDKEKDIKLKDYLICTITKKMFEECNFNINDLEESLINDDPNKCRDYEVRVTFKNQDLFWKAGWYVDGGRLVRKIYEVNESNVNKHYKRFKSDNINLFDNINKVEEDENSKNILKKVRKEKRKSFNFVMK